MRYQGENLENDRDQDGTKEVVDIEIFQQIFQHRALLMVYRGQKELVLPFSLKDLKGILMPFKIFKMASFILSLF